MTKIINNEHVFILAEVAQSYEGDIDILVQIAQKACLAGVDGVMFQVVFADELTVPEHACYNLFQSLEMPNESWKKVIDVIHAEDKLAIGEIFGNKSLDMMVRLEIDGLKIHAADISNHALLYRIGQTKLPALLAVGGAYKSEIQSAIKALKDGGSQEIVLLYGYQLCPTQVEDSHLNKISPLEKEFNLPVGFSDHLAGCIDNKIDNVNEMAFYFPLIAIGAGAKLIEKHIILDRTKAWEDYESAITAKEFIKFVELVRTYEKSLGTKDITINNAEGIYRTGAIKYVVASRNIAVNTILSEKDVIYKRVTNPEEGIPHMSDILGKIVNQDVNENQTITKNLF